MVLSMKKILLSIKPCYVAEILAGRKKVEYRKRIPRDADVRQVLIYASSPMKKVVAEFTIAGYLKSSPDSLWRQTSLISGVSKEGFDRYFKGKKIAYAYQIADLRKMEPSRTLADYGLRCGPQDYCYVEDLD